MSKRDPLILVEDVRAAISKIERYIATLDHDQFLADEMRQDAVARNLEIIGEAVRQMPDDFKQAHADVPSGSRGRALAANRRSKKSDRPRLLRPRLGNHLARPPKRTARVKDSLADRQLSS